SVSYDIRSKIVVTISDMKPFRCQFAVKRPEYAREGPPLTVIDRNHVQVHGSGDRTMVFAHGFGCDQNMWRFVEPAFRDRYRTVLFDHVGAGRSDLIAYDENKYSDLRGYASDGVEIGSELGLENAIF